jgi:hypothetical protein
VACPDLIPFPDHERQAEIASGAAVAACGLLLLLATFLAPPKIKRLVANKLGLDKG